MRCPRLRGMTLFEVVLAMAILVGIAGGVLLTLRTSVETSVRVARVRDDDAIVYSFVEMMRDTLRNLPGNAGFQALVDKSGSPPSWRVVIEEPGRALGFGQVSFDRQRVVLETERRAGGLLAAQVTAFPRTRKLSDEPVPLVLLDDLELITWRFYDPRSQIWQEDWQDGGFRPTAVELTLRRQNRPEVVGVMEVTPKPVAPSAAPQTAGSETVPPS